MCIKYVTEGSKVHGSFLIIKYNDYKKLALIIIKVNGIVKRGPVLENRKPEVCAY